MRNIKLNQNQAHNAIAFTDPLAITPQFLVYRPAKLILYPSSSVAYSGWLLNDYFPFENNLILHTAQYFTLFTQNPKWAYSWFGTSIQVGSLLNTKLMDLFFITLTE